MVLCSISKRQQRSDHCSHGTHARKFIHSGAHRRSGAYHIVDNGNIIIRSSLGSGITSAAGDGMVVAYEADAIDPETRTGWSVVVTGVAQVVTDPAELLRYQGLLDPWVDGERNSVVRIPAELVTGYELVPESA